MTEYSLLMGKMLNASNNGEYEMLGKLLKEIGNLTQDTEKVFSNLSQKDIQKLSVWLNELEIKYSN